MNNLFKLMLIFVLLKLIRGFDDNWNCSLARFEAIELFKQKVLLNQYPEFENNPYLNQTSKSLLEINEILHDRSLVCAIKYTDVDRIQYEIRNFQDEATALANDYIITHQGRCGACSNLNDLGVFLTGDLTKPARKCGMLGALSSNLAKECLKNIGFTDQCADIWLFNTINSRKNCFGVCMIAWIFNEPFTKPDGSLNDCLQCDEDKSGPVFQYYSGRTRRNSGIKSEIDRPTQQIFNVTHCYY